MIQNSLKRRQDRKAGEQGRAAAAAGHLGPKPGLGAAPQEGHIYRVDKELVVLPDTSWGNTLFILRRGMTRLVGSVARGCSHLPI